MDASKSTKSTERSWPWVLLLAVEFAACLALLYYNAHV